MQPEELRQLFSGSGLFEPRFTFDSSLITDCFGLWMIEGTAFRSQVDRVNGLNLYTHTQPGNIQQLIASRDTGDFQVDADDSSMAVFELRGPMMKPVSSLTSGGSYVRFRQQIKAARMDSSIRGGLLLMDTPGGTAKGNEDAAIELRKFAAEKPVFAFVEDMTASAGVSIASQATRIYANNDQAQYGAMGTYAVIQDSSAKADKLGLTVHVIKAGEFKGVGTPGTEISEQQLAELQRIVNVLNDKYLQLIADGLGRSVDSVRPLADGRVIFAADAVDAGLINGVKSLEETKQELADSVSTATTVRVTPVRSETEMSDNDKTPATLQELKSAFPDSTAEWRESQLEANSDMQSAAIAYGRFVKEQADAQAKAHAEALAAKDKELEDAKQSKPKTTPDQSLGADALTIESLQNYDSVTGDAVDDFSQVVSTLMQQTGCTRREAVMAARRKHPELSQAYLMKTNSDKGAQRVLSETFDRFQKQTS